MTKGKIPKYEVTPTTVTNVTSTTTVTLHPGGDIIEELIVEPIGEKKYLFCKGNKRGIAKAQFNEEFKYYFLDIDGKQYQLKDKPIKTPFFRIPDDQAIQAWLDGEYKTRPIEDIFNDIVIFYRTSFDLVNEKNAIILSLRDMVSWLRDVLQSFFFIGVDATQGSGKTSLLYAGSLLQKHGAMSGDISTAYLARVIDKQKLCLSIDELDELNKERKSELESILRKAQRAGNTYNRVNPSTLEPESFNVYGPHSFSYRTTIEGALKSRCLTNRLRVSSDKSLPVINYHVVSITKPLFNDLFFYYLEHAIDFVRSSSQVAEVTQLLGGLHGTSVTERRNKLFDFFTKDFTEEEVDLMDSLIGRNIELAYISLQATHILKLNIFQAIKSALESKQAEESIPDSFYLDKLKEFLAELFTQHEAKWTLQKGEHEGCFYYPKTKVFSEFIQSLKKQDIPPIGTSKFNGLLKDIGFVEGINWGNQKDAEGKPVRCLIYDSAIMRVIPKTKKLDHNEKADNYLKEWKQSGADERKFSDVEANIGRESLDYLKGTTGQLLEPRPGWLKPI